jgi:N-ethylmaleimide reductase
LTECTGISEDSNSFPGALNIYTEEQTEAIKKVVDAVHEKGGLIYL